MAGAAKARTESPEPGNGLVPFTLHAMDEASSPAMTQLDQEQGSVPSFAGPSPVDEVTPDTAARRYLDLALQSTATPGFTAPGNGGGTTDFLRLGSEALPLTGTVVVKFRQTFDRIPLYGSLVTVELDADGNSLVGINSQLGDPSGVSPLAKIAPAEAVALVAAHPAYAADPAGITPQLYYYFDQKASRWRLAYILENVPVAPAPARKSGAGKAAGKTATSAVPAALEAMDYVVDAHRGRVLALLPRTPTMAAVQETAADAMGVDRSFTAEKTSQGTILADTTANVRTFDFAFADPDGPGSLPGAPIKRKAAAPRWDPAGVSAHANAADVARYLRDVLKRANIDGNGGPMISTVNCVVARESRRPKEWLNAFWSPLDRQMVYGQAVLPGGGTRSLSANIDVVGHEMMHGVTERTARLEYRFQSGALNESYSDIFGTLIANHGNVDTGTWNWELGEKLLANGRPFRDLQNPARFGQPEHMSQYRQMPDTDRGDHGGVHVNSGIHNKAAYLLLTAGPANDRTLTPDEVAALFYLALTQYLSRTSQFSDSRRGVLSAGRTLFRSLPASDQARKITAIEDAFGAVGIV